MGKFHKPPEPIQTKTYQIW